MGGNLMPEVAQALSGPAVVALEAVGWLGSALLIFSILQPDIRRLRWLNLAASVVLTAYNLLIPAWPMVAMNVAVAAINVYYLAAEHRRQRSAAADEPATAGELTSRRGAL